MRRFQWRQMTQAEAVALGVGHLEEPVPGLDPLCRFDLAPEDRMLHALDEVATSARKHGTSAACPLRSQS